MEYALHSIGQARNAKKNKTKDNSFLPFALLSVALCDYYFAEFFVRYSNY